MRKFLPANRINKNRGFTLVEALVAVSVFSVSVLALMAVLGKGVADTNYAKRKTVAIYLAQEGIEFTRNLRDTYMLYDASGWSLFETKLTTSGCTAANGCFYNDSALAWTGDSTMPIIDTAYTACTSSTCNNGALLYNAATGKYGFSGTSSGFTRQIKATIVSSGTEVKISSTVYWIQGSGTYQVTLSENLFNWAE